MNRTTVITAALSTAVLLAAMSAQTNKPRVSACADSGRYQLFTGEHLIGGEGTATTAKDILKIDTLTGETSQWVNGSKNGSAISFWAPIK
jgi:hypothetical protein